MQTTFRVEELFSSRASQAPVPLMSANATIPMPDLVRFGGGIPDPATFPLAAFAELFPQILAADNFAAFNYGGTAGYEPLRQQIAEHLGARDGVRIGSESVTLVNGIAGGIGMAATAFLDPGDVVIAEEASFPGSLFSFRLMGARIVAAPIDHQGLMPDALQAIIEGLRHAGDRVKMLYTITNFQNPTGSTLPAARREAIAELCIRNGILILQDDAYGDIRFMDDVPPSFLHYAPEHAIEVGTFSKTIAPGLRLGWTASSPAIASGVTRVRMEMGTTPMLQRLVSRYLADGLFLPHIAEVNALYRQKRDAIVTALRTHCSENATWTEPEGGFFIWVTLNAGDASALAKVATSHGVVINPGAGFHVTSPKKQTFRLSYSFIPIHEITLGIERLGAAMRAYAAQG